MKSGNARLRLLTVLEILRKESDENTPVNVSRIIDVLSSRGIIAERKAIYEDIACLNEYGFEIDVGRGKNSGYRFLSHGLCENDANLIVDAIRSSGFVSDKGALKLTEKLSESMSRSAAERLGKRQSIVNPDKCATEELYDTINTLSLAIAESRQVKIVYSRNKIEGHGIVTAEKVMTVDRKSVV